MFILLRTLATIRRQTRLPPGSSRWLAIRHVDAGSCNGCEHELGAVSNPFHDLQRHGLDIVASPRHADILLVTGPITTRMAGPLRTAYNAMPEPRLVAALGDCALGCNILGHAEELVGPLENVLPVDIRIPGCPPTPDAIAERLLAAIKQNTRPGPLGKHSDNDWFSWLLGRCYRNATWSAVSTPAADGCLARMMREPNRARLASDAALLRLRVVGRLVSRENDHALYTDCAGDCSAARECFHARAPATLRRAPQPGEQLDGLLGAGVVLAPKKRRKPRRGEPGRVGWGWIARRERERDLAVQIAEPADRPRRLRTSPSTYPPFLPH